MRSIKIYALKYWALVTVRSFKIPAYWEKGRTGRMRFSVMHLYTIIRLISLEEMRELLIHFRVVI